MPIPVTKYRCDFKCGAKALGDRRKMVTHEKNCLKNPENKSCMTCVNQVYDRDSSEEGGVFHIRGCKLERMERFFADVHESLVVLDSAYQHVRPLVHCPNWGKTEIVPWTEAYIKEIQPKIEKAQKERLNRKNNVIPF
jgi:hypothetical protein